MRSLRKLVFWPPFLLLFAAVAASLAAPNAFLKTAKQINQWILGHFDWLFCITALWLVLLCIIAFTSRWGQVRIGGPDALPLLSRWQWFSITLCTTVAIGILFWATAEPLYHLKGPAKSLGLTPNTPAAAKFALSTMYMHWTFTPYAIYTVPSLMFAYAFYNRKQPFSLRATLSPLWSAKFEAQHSHRIGTGVDAISLFALVLGMAASLGSGMLTLAGGFGHYFNHPTNSYTLGLVGLTIVLAFCASSASGLQRGIRWLSDINVRIFFGLCLFVFVFGPTTFQLRFGLESFGVYLGDFFSRSLLIGALPQDTWPQNWSVFYWAVWMAWAPVTAMFLGRIARGYTVREFILFNWIFPSIFSAVWMAIFSGTTIHMELLQQAGLTSVLQTKGVNFVVFSFLSKLPGSAVIILLFLLTCFLSYVTAADSNTSAMAAISTEGISADAPNPPLLPKLLWGISVGAVAWIMTSSAGIDGIKMLSNIGGLPALFLLLAISFALLKTIIQYTPLTSTPNSEALDSFQTQHSPTPTPTNTQHNPSEK